VCTNVFLQLRQHSWQPALSLVRHLHEHVVSFYVTEGMAEVTGRCLGLLLLLLPPLGLSTITQAVLSRTFGRVVVVFLAAKAAQRGLLHGRVIVRCRL
jgi:hypothetical protein